jgi:hypothetical protein
MPVSKSKLFSGRLNQRLEERSSLTFEFNNRGGIELRRIPFFENPIIVESKRANYIKYNILGRSTPLYSYFNSDSRIFDIDFYITTPLIREMYADLVSLTFPKKQIVPFTDPDAFFENSSENIENSNIPDPLTYKVNGKDSLQYVNDFTTLINETDISIIPTESSTNLAIRAKVVDIIMYWVNMIRSSVVNNAENVLLPPPIIRIRHGILYQDIAGICMSYKIDKDENAGYDRETLLPRRLQVSMQLAELKQGDFTKYKVNDLVKRDNIKGWEAIINKDGSMSLDPVIM